MRQPFFGLVAIALCLMPTLISAQRVSEIQKGVRVRITESQGQRFAGSFVSSTADSVVLLPDGASVLHSTASTDVAGFEVSTGRHRAKSVLVKGMIGLGIGLASGALLGAATYSEPTPKQCTPDPNDIFGFGCLFTNACFVVCSRGEAAGFGAVLGAASGLVAGSIVGIVTGRERWKVAEFR